MNPLKSATVIGANADPATYHQEEFKRGDSRYVMSRSSLMTFATNPHRWVCGFSQKDSKATEWGTLMDCLVLTPESFEKLFAVKPKTYFNDKGEEKEWHWASKKCQAWEEARKHLTMVSDKLFNLGVLAKESLFADEQIAEYIQCSQKQVLVRAEYQDRETGLVVPIKLLIDLVPNKNHSKYGRSLADFKTCESAARGPWKAKVFNYNYNVQAALYYDAYTLATGEDRTEFRHIIQESYAPWESGKRFLSSEFLELGRAKYVRALKEYCQCLATKKWPRYDEREGQTFDGWSIVSPEMWMETRQMEDAHAFEEPPETPSEDVGIIP